MFVIVRLPTPLRRVLLMIITNRCMAKRKMSRTKNKSKYIHNNSLGDTVRLQIVSRESFVCAHFKILKLYRTVSITKSR